MKQLKISLLFLSLIIVQKNLSMDLAVRKSPQRTGFAIAHAAQEAYHPDTVRHFQDGEEYDPSCTDLACAYNAFMIARKVTTIVLPNDPIVAGLSGAAACATTLFAAKKIKTAHSAYIAKEKTD
jgi:hypothetical protein